MSPLSTSSAWRTRAGTDVSATTFWPSAASVEASIVDSRTTDASAMPGNTSQPTPTPATMVSGSPMSSSRLGQPSSRRRERRSRRAASLNSSRTSAISVMRSATADSTETSSQPSADAPTTKPAAVKNSAEVIPRRSSGPENALQTMMITTMVAAVATRPPPSLDAGSRLAAAGAILPPSGNAVGRTTAGHPPAWGG